MASTRTRTHRLAAFSLVGLLTLGGVACSDDADDNGVNDDLENDVSDVGDDVSEGVDDLSDELSQQMDEGTEEDNESPDTTGQGGG